MMPSCQVKSAFKQMTLTPVKCIMQIKLSMCFKTTMHSPNFPLNYHVPNSIVLLWNKKKVKIIKERIKEKAVAIRVNLWFMLLFLGH